MILKPMVTALLISLILKPCLSSNASNLSEPNFKIADKIKIHYFKAKRPLIYTTSNKVHLTFFKELIKKAKNDPNLKCDTTGVIMYFNGNRPLLKVYFSTRATGTKLTSTATSYHVNTNTVTSLLTYNVGMMIDEVYYKLSNSS